MLTWRRSAILLWIATLRRWIRHDWRVRESSLHNEKRERIKYRDDAEEKGFQRLGILEGEEGKEGEADEN